MAETELHAYLRQQARSLDSLLALTPAKMMFGEDNSDQWQRKKQTPEQKRVARKAKLDPANWRSAKDVYDERERQAVLKRKREAGEDLDGKESGPADQPPPPKKSKPGDGIEGQLGEGVDILNANRKRKLKKKENKRKKAEAQQQRAEKLEADKGKQIDELETGHTTKKQSNSKPVGKAEKEPNTQIKKKPTEDKSKEQNTKQDGSNPPHSAQQKAKSKQLQQPADDLDLDFSKAKSLDEEMAEAEEEDDESSAEEAEQAPPGTDDEAWTDAESVSTDIPEIMSPAQESLSSSSSIQPPPIPATNGKSHKETKPHTSQSSSTNQAQQPLTSEEDKTSRRERLQAAISNFRTARKADSKPIRSRADLLAARRQKETERKEELKAQRQKQREEEAKRNEEEMIRRFSPGGSGSLLASPRSPIVDDSTSGGFSFGRIGFDDGTQLDANGDVVEERKKKGPRDARGALKVAEAKNERLKGLDENKRKDIEEKDMWLNAKRRAHGERTKDDVSLLKKALKRTEKDKKRSEGEWDKRKEGVRAGIEAKQKRRTENLQKRKDEKGAKKVNGKFKKRPGFEGSFRGRTGGKKKS